MYSLVVLEAKQLFAENILHTQGARQSNDINQPCEAPEADGTQPDEFSPAVVRRMPSDRDRSVTLAKAVFEFFSRRF
jgi:hypothetical protein